MFQSVLTAFGDFDLDDITDSNLGKILFLLAATSNLLIMLNLVIAIISDAFASVNMNRLNFFYMQRARLISEVWQVFGSR